MCALRVSQRCFVTWAELLQCIAVLHVRAKTIVRVVRVSDALKASVIRLWFVHKSIGNWRGENATALLCAHHSHVRLDE